jgi:hypothetical protein
MPGAWLGKGCLGFSMGSRPHEASALKLTISSHFCLLLSMKWKNRPSDCLGRRDLGKKEVSQCPVLHLYLEQSDQQEARGPTQKPTSYTEGCPLSQTKQFIINGNVFESWCWRLGSPMSWLLASGRDFVLHHPMVEGGKANEHPRQRVDGSQTSSFYQEPTQVSQH